MHKMFRTVSLIFCSAVVAADAINLRVRLSSEITTLEDELEILKREHNALLLRHADALSELEEWRNPRMVVAGRSGSNTAEPTAANDGSNGGLTQEWIPVAQTVGIPIATCYPIAEQQQLGYARLRELCEQQWLMFQKAVTRHEEVEEKIHQETFRVFSEIRNFRKKCI